MSDNQPKWTDKVNVALNVVQTVQLSQISDALRSLTQLECERARMELTGKEAQACEDRIREIIWRTEQVFLEYTEGGTATPSGVYALSNQIQWSFQQSKVTSATLRQFGDKDRLNTLQKMLQQSIEQASKQLLPEQKAEADTYLRHLSESGELDFLLEDGACVNTLTSAQQQADAAAKELRQLLEPLINPKTVERMKELEGTLKSATEEEDRLNDASCDAEYDSKEWNEIEQKLKEASNRGLNAATQLKRLTEESCERLGRTTTFWGGLLGKPAAGHALDPSIKKRIEILRETIRAADEEAEAAEMELRRQVIAEDRETWQRKLELSCKHGHGYETWKKIKAEHSASMVRFRQANNL